MNDEAKAQIARAITQDIDLQLGTFLRQTITMSRELEFAHAEIERLSDENEELKKTGVVKKAKRPPP